jgi:hypothetical protein
MELEEWEKPAGRLFIRPVFCLFVRPFALVPLGCSAAASLAA